MKIIKSLCIAFSMYSKVPMPQFEWKEEDMKYSLCFLSWVGVLIAVLFVLLNKIAKMAGLGQVSIALLLTALPLIVTGGIHVDGYMDTMDALHSYQEKEKKLEILKDPHIGAFSVIMLLLYVLVYLAFLLEADSRQEILMIALGFILSRVAGAMSVVAFHPAKENGLLRIFADAASKKTVMGILVIEGCVCVALMMAVSKGRGICVIASVILWFLYYKKICDQQFGGVSGDTSGYFITICELIVVVVTVLGNL